MDVKSVMKLFGKLNPWKTLYFNIHYFPIKYAVRLPIFIYWRSEIYKMKGEIVIDAPIKTGMIRIGEHGLGTQDLRYSRTIWEVMGSIVIKGKTSIGRGCKISIGKNAKLILGEDFLATGNSEIIWKKEISFGSQCLLSWDILIMDTDFHYIFDDKDNLINPPKPIKFGNHVWIGCRNTILKGVSVPDDVIISANSTITRSVNETNSVVGGHGKSVEVLKRGISWKKTYIQSGFEENNRL